MKSQAKSSVLNLLLGLALGGIAPFASAAPQVTAIDFKPEGSGHVLEIKTSEPITYERTENAADGAAGKQLVLDLKGATIPDELRRPLDTSSFDSQVSLISPDANRVVLQMRDGAGDAPEITQDGNVIRVKVGSMAPPPPPAEEIPAPPLPPSPAEAAAPLAPAAPATAAVAAPGPAPAKTNLDQFMEARESRRFVGRPITLQVRDADLVDVFRLIGESSGFNIILGDDVKGRVTLSLSNVPWDQALDTILHSQKLGAERNNNLLRIASLTSLTAEKQQELQARLAAEASAPRVTRIFPISYARLTDLQTILQKFGNSGPGAGLMGQGNTAVVEIDNRTNSIVVRDIPDNLDRMKKLIELLDTQTPQVLIEAKIVDASEQFRNQLSGNIGFGNNNTAVPFTASFAGANPLSALIGSPGVFPDSAGAASAASTAKFAASPNLSIIPGFERLNALLEIGESESQVKVVTSPKTVVLNKQTANITQTTPVVVTQVVVNNGVQTNTPIQLNATVNLQVTPTVTNEGSVLLDLQIQRDVPQQNSVAGRNMKTQVLVDSGATLVIGGIYSHDVNKSSGGFPFLRKIPILGMLFGFDNATEAKSELIIFVTPRILNPREAGLGA